MSSITPINPADDSSLHTLQAYIELVYVRVANEVMSDKLIQLNNGMSTTQAVMDSLTRVQQLKNLIVSIPKGAFNSATYNWPGPIVVVPDDPGGLVSGYTSAASAFFGTPVSVSGNFGPLGSGGVGGTFAMFQSMMNSVRASISAQIAQLSAITPRIQPGNTEDSNSLLAKLRIVYNETAGVAASQTAALTWIVDKYNETSTSAVSDAGLLQQHITDAITAGQSLNSNQTEDLRSFMYLFEEYYKSASAILQAMTQIIQKMADGISR